jgi:hypothetical protein
MGKYQIKVEIIPRGSFDSQSDKLDVKGKKVNLTIWVRSFGGCSPNPDRSWVFCGRTPPGRSAFVQSLPRIIAGRRGFF